MNRTLLSKQNFASPLAVALMALAFFAVALLLAFSLATPAFATGNTGADGQTESQESEIVVSGTTIKTFKGESIPGVTLNLFDYDTDVNGIGLGNYGYLFFNADSLKVTGDDGKVNAAATAELKAKYIKDVLLNSPYTPYTSGVYNKLTLASTLDKDGNPHAYIPYLVNGERAYLAGDGDSKTYLYVARDGNQNDVPCTLDADGNLTAVYRAAGTAGGVSDFAKIEGADLSRYTVPTISLDYLFDTSSTYYKGTSDNGGGLFRTDLEGFHYYDSKQNAASAKISESGVVEFTLYDAILRPIYTKMTQAATTEGEAISNFLPFNEIDSNTAVTTDEDEDHTVDLLDSTESGSPVALKLGQNAQVDLWFGMTVDFDFYMPKGGMVDGEKMVFDFHGDDDVFVYINGVLVLDIGGTHAAEDGWIDFSTGVVFDPTCITTTTKTVASATEGTTETYYTAADGAHLDGLVKERVTVTKSGEKFEITTEAYEYKTLLEIFKAAKGADFEPHHFNGNTLADYTENSLKFFYMERGGNISFCRLNFNMPVLSSDLNVIKHIDEDCLSHSVDGLSDADYTFKLTKKQVNGTGEAVVASGVSYRVIDRDGTVSGIEYTDNEGQFTLKANEAASFSFEQDALTGYEYQVEEIAGPSAVSSVECRITQIGLNEDHHSGSLDPLSADKTCWLKLSPDVRTEVEFENALEAVDPGSLAFDGTKELMTGGVFADLASYPGDFEFQISLVDGDGDALVSELETVKVDKETGIFAFSAVEYTQDDYGKHFKYLIEEVPGDNPYATYDAAKYLVTVYVGHVLDEINGKVVIKPEVGKIVKIDEENLGGVIVYLADGSLDSSDASDIVFVNEYNPPAVASVRLEAVKTLDGKQPGSNEFTFEVKDSEGEVVATAKNDAAGVIEFEPLSFDAAGTYSYTVSEVVGTDSGIVYDTAVYAVTIVVEDNGEGAYEASVSVAKNGKAYDGAITFANETDIPLPSAGGKDDPLPSTGDEAPLVVLGVVALVAAAVLAVALHQRKRHARSTGGAKHAQR